MAANFQFLAKHWSITPTLPTAYSLVPNLTLAIKSSLKPLTHVSITSHEQSIVTEITVNWSKHWLDINTQWILFLDPSVRHFLLWLFYKLSQVFFSPRKNLKHIHFSKYVLWWVFTLLIKTGSSENLARIGYIPNIWYIP